MTDQPRTSGATKDSARADKWPMMGALAGLLIGAFDTVSLTWIGVDMRVDGENVFVAVMVLFSASFALFGYVIGLMAQLRRKSRLDAATIRDQLNQLEKSRRELIEAEKLATLGRMAAGVAHEVRNPLGVMRSSAALLAEELPEDAEEQRRVCLFIREEVDRLEAFVSAILQYARPIAADTEAVQLSDVVASAQRLGREHLGERRLTTSGDGVVEADEDLIVPLVLGLLVNAAEATEATGRVDVAIEAMDDHVDLSVADDGKGVAADASDKLFEPFFTTKARGTGLGLAMAARVAEAHAGQLRHDGPGIDGRGARFTLTLPAASGAA